MNIKIDPIVRKVVQESTKLVAEHKFDEARENLLSNFSDLQKFAPDKLGLHIGSELERLGLWPQAWAAYANMPNANDCNLPDWKGQSLGNSSLLVRKRVRDIGSDLRIGRLIELAGRRSAHCVGYVDERLVPLFRRSFTSASFESISRKIPFTEFHYQASYEIIGRYLACTENSIRRQFVPLVADLNTTKRIRRFYCHHAGTKPIIGLSWHSNNTDKDMPDLMNWAQFIKAVDAQFVSINYGDRQTEIDFLRRISGKKIVSDPINQIQSLDDFAAQISAVDMVVCISNSTAHLSGSLSKRTHVILTEFSGMTWPVQGDTSPWYPETLLHRKNGNWDTVLLKLADQIQHQL